MKRLKQLLGMTFFACAFALTSCGLLETPEYPDSDFSIVGTWEYHIPALSGSKPKEGSIYNADGRITFTADGRFSFVIDSDQGEVKGCGTYEYDGDDEGMDASGGIALEYDSYKEIELIELALKIPHAIIDRYLGYIRWGNEGDLVEDDYIVSEGREFYRVSEEPYDENLATYTYTNSKGEELYGLVDFGGDCMLSLPITLDRLYGLYDEFMDLQK